MTNGDKLRQMTDEELLTFFFGPEAFLVSMPIEERIVKDGVTISNLTTIRFIDWMKEEAK